jgi:hypothetical protein
VEGVVVRKTTINKFNDSQAIAFNLEGLDKGYYEVRLIQSQINTELGGFIDETKKVIIVK